MLIDFREEGERASGGRGGHQCEIVTSINGLSV